MPNYNNYWAEKTAKRNEDYFKPERHLEIIPIGRPTTKRLMDESNNENHVNQNVTPDGRPASKRYQLAEPIFLNSPNTPKSSLKRPSTDNTDSTKKKKVRFEDIESNMIHKEEHRKAIAELQQSLNSEQNKNKNKDAVIERLRKNEQQAKTREAELEKKIFELQSTSLGPKPSISTIDTSSLTNNKTVQKLEKKVKQIKKLRRELVAKTVECDKLTLKLDEFNSANQTLIKQKDGLEREIEEMKKSEEERFQNRIEEIKAEMFEQTKERFKNWRENEKKKVQDVENKLSKMNKLKDELEQNLADEKKLNENFGVQIAYCINKIKLLDANASNSIKKFDELKKLKKAYEKLLEMCNAQAKTIEQQATQIQCNEDQLDLLKSNHKHERQQREYWQNEFNNLNQRFMQFNEFYARNYQSMLNVPFSKQQLNQPMQKLLMVNSQMTMKQCQQLAHQNQVMNQFANPMQSFCLQSQMNAKAGATNDQETINYNGVSNYQFG